VSCVTRGRYLAPSATSFESHQASHAKLHIKNTAHTTRPSESDSQLSRCPWIFKPHHHIRLLTADFSMFGNIGLIRDRNDLRRQWHHRETAATAAADHSPATIPKNVVSTTPKPEASSCSSSSLQVLTLIERPSLESRRSLGESGSVVSAAENGRDDKANRTE
jgi:hypothetical protein